MKKKKKEVKFYFHMPAPVPVNAKRIRLIYFSVREQETVIKLSLIKRNNCSQIGNS